MGCDLSGGDIKIYPRPQKWWSLLRGGDYFRNELVDVVFASWNGFEDAVCMPENV